MDRSEVMSFFHETMIKAGEVSKGWWIDRFTDAFIASGAVITLPKKPKTYTVVLDFAEKFNVCSALGLARETTSQESLSREFESLRAKINALEPDK